MKSVRHQSNAHCAYFARIGEYWTDPWQRVDITCSHFEWPYSFVTLTICDRFELDWATQRRIERDTYALRVENDVSNPLSLIDWMKSCSCVTQRLTLARRTRRYVIQNCNPNSTADRWSYTDCLCWSEDCLSKRHFRANAVTTHFAHECAQFAVHRANE